jgi:hypothetical protein
MRVGISSERNLWYSIILVQQRAIIYYMQPFENINQELRLKAATDVLDLDVTLLLEARGHDVGLNSLEINIGDLGVFTIEDLGDLLKGGAFGLDVEDADEDELEGDPALATIST